MVWITLAVPNTALRSFGRRAAAMPNGRLTARPISSAVTLTSTWPPR